FLFRLNIIRIRNTAVYRANGGTLRLFMETAAFCALARYDIIKFVGNRSLRRFAVNGCSIFQLYFLKFGASSPIPLSASFVDCCVGALRFACTTVDALIGNYNCHAFPTFESLIDKNTSK